MKKLKAIALVAALLIVLTGAGARAVEAQPLLAMLEKIPLAAFDGSLSFVDYQALVALQPGAVAPASAEAAPEHLKTPEGQAYMQALRGVSAGFTSLVMFMSLPDVKQSSGLDPYLMTQSMEVGEGQRQVWVRGPIAEAELTAALTAKGYERQEQDGEMALWCEGGSCDGGLRMDLSRRDPAFLFGGDLGRFWPVAIGEGLVVAARSGEELRLIAGQQEPKAVEDARVQALLNALAIPDSQAPGQLIQLITLHYPGVTDQAIIGIAQVAAADAQWVIVTRPWYGVEAGLATVKPMLETTALGFGERGTLTEAIARFGGELQAPRLVQSGAVKLLVLPFRFPSAEEAHMDNPEAAISLPFQWFIRRLTTADWGWLLNL